MARNVEIKARVRDVAGLRRGLEALADGPGTVLEQEDVFFAVAEGRLKLRREAGRGARLIAYRRPDARGPKTSRYVLMDAPQPDVLEAALSLSPGVMGRVKKRRELRFCGRTRLHLDEVEGLGAFLEFEVVLEDGEPEAEGVSEARRLMTRLGLKEGDLVAAAYIDLLGEARA